MQVRSQVTAHIARAQEFRYIKSNINIVKSVQ